MREKRVFILLILNLLPLSCVPDDAVLPDRLTSVEAAFPSALPLVRKDRVEGDEKEATAVGKAIGKLLLGKGKKEIAVADSLRSASQLEFERDELQAQAYSLLQKGYRDPLFTGTRITLRARDLPVTDFMGVVAGASGIQYAIDPDVEGTIKSFRAEDMPLSTVVPLVLDQLENPLCLVKYHDLWRLMPRQRALAHLGLEVANQRLQSIDLECYTVKSAKWNDDLRGRVEKLWQAITGGKAKQAKYIFFDNASRKIFFRGSGQETRDFFRCLEAIDLPAAQVSLEARIVLADKNFDEAFGVEWSGIYDRSANIRRFAWAGVGIPSKEPFNQLGDFSKILTWSFNLIPSTMASMTKLISFPVNFGNKNMTHRLNLALNAAENSHQIKTLLKPSMLINNDEKAEILVGDEMPHNIKMEEVIEGRLANATTTNYKDIGTKIQVQPAIAVDLQGLWLDVFIEHSCLAPAQTFLRTQDDKASARGYYDYTIKTVRTKNKVFLRSGQTTMIGGLMVNITDESETGVPGLRDIPVLGWLFKGKSKKMVEKQLLIFLTPAVV